HPGAVAFSFSPDGRSVVSAAGTSLRVWSVPSGKEIGRKNIPLPVSGCGIAAIAHGPKGQLFVVGEGITRFDAGLGKPTPVKGSKYYSVGELVLFGHAAWLVNWGRVGELEARPLDGSRPPVTIKVGRKVDFFAISDSGTLLALGANFSGAVS